MIFALILGRGTEEIEILNVFFRETNIRTKFRTKDICPDEKVNMSLRIVECPRIFSFPSS